MTDSLIKVKKFLLLLGDLIILYFSLWLTLYFRYWPNFNPSLWQQHWLPFTFIYFIWLIIFYISGLYDLNLAKNTLKFYSILFKSLAISAGIAILFFYLIPYIRQRLQIKPGQ